MKCCKMSQKAASVFTAAIGSMAGADYEPVLYVGNQILNGMNYCFLAIQTLVIVNAPNRLVNDETVSLKSIQGISER